MKARRWWFIGSAVVIALGLASLGVNGLNRGIEFRGGTSWDVPSKTLTVSAARASLPRAMRDAKVQSVGSGANTAIRVQADPRGDADARRATVNQITTSLAKAGKIAE